MKGIKEEQVKETEYMTDEEYEEMYGEDDRAVEIMSIEEAMAAGCIMEDPDVSPEEMARLGEETRIELIKRGIIEDN